MRRFAQSPPWSLFGATAFAQDVKVDFDKDANFSVIKTFTVKIGTSWNNPISEKRVAGEIEQALTEKGWTKVEPDKADAAGASRCDREKQRTLNTFYSGTGAYGGYGWRGWGAGGGMGTATTTESEYIVGTLVVDIFDAKQLMFRGTAQDELSDKPEKNAKKLAKASDKANQGISHRGRARSSVAGSRRPAREVGRRRPALAQDAPTCSPARPAAAGTKRAPCSGRRRPR